MYLKQNDVENNVVNEKEEEEEEVRKCKYCILFLFIFINFISICISIFFICKINDVCLTVYI